MTYEEGKRIESRLAQIIQGQGMGAGTRWYEIAMAGMSGGPEAKAEIEKLLGRPWESMLDYWIVFNAAERAMTPGERHTALNRAEHRAQHLYPLQHVADKYLANRLGDLRRARGLTQQELARKAGVPIVTLQKLENGANAILGSQTRTTLRVAAALGITVEELVGLREQKNEEDGIVGKMYIVRPEYEDRWFGSEMPSPVDMAEIERLAVEWEMTVEELLEQVTEA